MTVYLLSPAKHSQNLWMDPVDAASAHPLLRAWFRKERTQETFRDAGSIQPQNLCLLCIGQALRNSSTLWSSKDYEVIEPTITSKPHRSKVSMFLCVFLTINLEGHIRQQALHCSRLMGTPVKHTVCRQKTSIGTFPVIIQIFGPSYSSSKERREILTIETCVSDDAVNSHRDHLNSTFSSSSVTYKTT